MARRPFDPDSYDPDAYEEPRRLKRFGAEVERLDPVDFDREQDLIELIRKQVEATYIPAPAFGIAAHCDCFCKTCGGLGRVDGAFCDACEGTGAESFVITHQERAA